MAVVVISTPSAKVIANLIIIVTRLPKMPIELAAIQAHPILAEIRLNFR
jgi:hypothetical protein